MKTRMCLPREEWGHAFELRVTDTGTDGVFSQEVADWKIAWGTLESSGPFPLLSRNTPAACVFKSRVRTEAQGSSAHMLEMAWGH
ncbi:hypothetical protein HPP92_001880 [Vanilla planifolia]|uniref:Uncharacterized protein n=1 Tax=Vanilla planifolia TaxID=51239 RepID=A0A835S5M1_VANPL|nr:hypothetical protein HPP92_002123 [Vanilla planifolia]KAG0501808.1 hypothetical protein HPP92_001880 [Vanilla planifolia]